MPTLSEMGEGATIDDLREYVSYKATHAISLRYLTVMDPECQVTDPNGKVDKYYTFDGDSRYENGFTEDTDYDGYHVDGGELQPWLTYTDENGEIREIMSGVQLVYSSCSGTTAQEWEGMCPVVTTSNLGEYYGSAYNTHNYLANFLRLYDVPSLYFELPIDHSLLRDKDIETGVDAYVSFFKFCDYYLKGTPVSVLYVDAANGERDVDTTEGIVIKFLGEVEYEEIKKVTIVDENGNAAVGEWVSSYGKTQWTFVPSALNGGVRYTVTVPADMKGANGKAMGESYTSSFYTKPETAEIYGMTENVSATSADGAYFSFTVPSELPAGSNRLMLRFRVANEAANIAQIYEASSSTDTTGKLIGSINLKGAGYYEYDVTSYVMSKSAGEKVYFYVKAEKAAADTVTYSHDFDKMTDISAYGSRSLVTSVNGESITALRHNLTYGIAKYGVSHGYSGWYPTAWENNKLINGGKPVTEADYGRTFTITLRLMATASRPIQVWMSDCTSADLERMDYSYSRVNVIAPAGEWIEISLPYTVYEMDYGVTSQTKILKIIEYFGGSDDMPVYYDSLTVTEHITDIEISEASLVSTSVGNGEYKAPESDMAFEVDGKQYATWWEAVLASDKAADHTVKLLSDYEFTASDNGVITALNTLNVDLNGYTVSLTDASLLNIGSVNKNAVRIEVSNGNVAVSDHPLITHSKDTADGEGKFYEIAFKNVYIDVVGGDTCDIIADFGTANSRNISRTITFEDCRIDADRRSLPKFMPLCLFPNDGSEYRLIGGEIRIDTTVRFSLVDDVRTLYFAKNGEGEYTVIKVADIYSLPADSSVTSDKGYANYVLGETADGYKNYSLTSAKYSTPYGIIPDDKSPEEYPFALFVDGELIGLYSSYCNGSDSMTDNALYGAFSYIRGEHNKEVQIYLRRDYDISSPETTDTYYKNLSQIGGTLVLHLGEYELTLGNVPLFNCDCKYGWTKATNVTGIYDTKIIVRGGTINASNASVINYSSLVCSTDDQKTNYNKQKLMDITFEGTVINTSVPLVRKANPVNEQYGALLDLDFNDCEINLSSVTSSVTLFNAAESLKMNDLAVSINGGNITASSVSNIILLSGDAEDSVIFSTDKYGEYTTLTMPKDATLTCFGGTNDKGAFVEFGEGVTVGENTVYTLAKSDDITKYGAIPDEYASVEDYPFAVFSDGKFVKAFQLLINNNDSDGVTSAFEQARALTFGKTGVNAQILMRRNYACTSSEWGYNNLSHMTGDVTIDLGGYTLTTTGGPMLQLTVKTVNPSTMNLINGTLITKQALVSVVSLINANYNASAGEKIFNFNFEDLNIVYGSATYQALIVYTKAESGGTPTKSDFININVNNCKLDISALGSVTVPLVVGADKLGTNVNNINVTVNGGSLVTSKANISLGSFDPQVGVNGDSLKFGKGKNGYMEIVTTSETVPSFKLPTADGELSYGRYSSEKVNGVTTYVNRVGAETEYGVIPFDYPADKYPFAVFKDGVLLGAHDAWGKSNAGSALYTARLPMAGSKYSDVSVQILLRSDYTTETTRDEWYANLAHFGGTLTVDLGGHTFTANGRPMFIAKAQTAGADFVSVTKMIIKNGRIVSSGNPIINANTEVVASRYENYIDAKVFDFVFTDVDFSVIGTKPIINVTNTNHDYGAIFNVAFNNCNFDVTKSSGAFNIFSCTSTNDPKGANVVNVTVNGGNLSAKSLAKINIFAGDSADTFVFGKDSNGNMTTITLPSGVAAPTAEFNTVDGMMVFTATDVEGKYVLAVAHTHSYNAVVTDPTCTEQGYTTYSCACGDTYTDNVVPAIGHAYDNDYDADCNRCGEIREVEIPVTVVAEGKCGVNTTWVLTSDGVLTVSGNGDTEDYLVSITTEQPYRVYQDMITKVVFEEGVTSIGRGAFYGFTNITEVVFPESLIAIHEYAFFGCTAIKTMNIPENTFYIGLYALRKTGLKTLTFANPEGWTFSDGTALDVTNVKAFTTENTYKQTCMRPVTENGTVIANGVFGNKEQFSWTLSSTGLLTVSGKGNMPKFNVNTTPWYGYRGAIRSVIINEGITSVGRCSFHTCRAITSVTLPESLETIAEYAFYNCQFLTEATIPANVTRIEIFAFRKCFELKSVEFAINYGWSAGDDKVSATELNSNAADMLTLVNYTKIWTRDINAEEEILDPNYVTGGACNTTIKWALTYVDDTKTKMKLTVSGTGAMPKFDTGKTPWYGYLNDIVEVEVCEGITEIGRCAFYGLKFVKNVTIADTVTAINDYAFSGCFSLKTIEIPASVTFIAETAFTKTGLSEIPTV